MDIGIGLPTGIPGTDGPTLIEWAQRADEAGFDSLGTLDRLGYDSYDPIVALAAAAAVTDDARLTAVVVPPYRGDGALLAKQLASLDQLSRGRVIVGIAAAHGDDELATADHVGRHDAAAHETLATMRAVWAGEARDAGAVGPAPAQLGGIPMLIGGTGPAAIRQVVDYGTGWIGSGTPETFRETAQRVQQAWSAAGREGEPYLAATAYFALGEHARAASRRYLLEYYGFLGDDRAGRVADGVLTGTGRMELEIAQYADAGCDELILFPCAAVPDEIELLAHAVLRLTGSPRSWNQ